MLEVESATAVMPATAAGAPAAERMMRLEVLETAACAGGAAQNAAASRQAATNGDQCLFSIKSTLSA
jgi:hypothetical protein